LIYVLILKRTIKNETVCKTHILKASLVGWMCNYLFPT
jgi:hypothetical protein